MLQNLKTNRILWILAALFSLIASLTGVFKQEIYRKAVSAEWLPGTISQDLITVFVSVVLLYLAAQTKEENVKKQIFAISFLAYLFYAYGIFVIERFYNPLYLIYIAIFTISFWSLIYGLKSIRASILEKSRISKLVRFISIGFLIFIPLLFYFLWTMQLLPLMQTGKKPEFAYSIYILDMAFVLPALIITAFLMIKKQGLGLVLAPILFFKAFTLLFSVGLGGVLKPYYNQSANLGEVGFYFGLAALFLILSIINFVSLKIDKQGRQ
ncbi:MAG: hypothetical protein A2074_04630 [Candidatus Aquicultor primus]|uniref:Uncharacterized protein n=1 Tax=Candidatus Aquicultor primus TaxID=1797195 RepID=A0A1F2UIC9_9ACTN|nr:MAG: hypothetical protein A2074_04630 [Candidatus Aquicultor primus]